MKTEVVHCPICGHRFDPGENEACGNCPLHQGCTIVCCPACGYSTIDPGRSKLVQIAKTLGRKNGFFPIHLKRLFAWLKDDLNLRLNGRGDEKSPRQAPWFLSEVSPGGLVQVVGFSENVSPNQRAHLQAYGLMPDHQVQVVQQSPVTIIQVAHTELALENELARDVQVKIF